MSYIFGTWQPNSGHMINGDINIVERFRPDFEENKITTIEMVFALNKQAEE